MWSVADAKTHLSEVLRLERAGEPQVIGTRQSCVVISAELYREKIENDRGHDGRWFIEEGAKVGVDMELPSRSDDRPELDWLKDW